jgi:hypothetical protein
MRAHAQVSKLVGQMSTKLSLTPQARHCALSLVPVPSNPTQRADRQAAIVTVQAILAEMARPSPRQPTPVLEADWTIL